MMPTVIGYRVKFRDDIPDLEVSERDFQLLMPSLNKDKFVVIQGNCYSTGDIKRMERFEKKQKPPQPEDYPDNDAFLEAQRNYLLTKDNAGK